MGFFNSLFNSSSSTDETIEKMETLIKRCFALETNNKISELQNCLYELYSLLNKPHSGRYIINYPKKEDLALCFAFMLQYDWINDSDIREVWAEDGFYCIMEYLNTQSYGRQGQIEGMIILFILLCVGRNSLKHEIQKILYKSKQKDNPIFHKDDYLIGAQNVIDQISLAAISGMREIGTADATIIVTICKRYNGFEFFNSIIQRTDLMKYDVMDVVAKMRFIHDVIQSILEDMQ